MKNISLQEKLKHQLTFNPGLTGFWTNQPGLQQVTLTWTCNPIEKPAFSQQSTSKNTWPQCSCDTEEEHTLFWLVSIDHNIMFNIKEGHYKPRLHVSFTVSCSMAAIFGNSAIVRVCPQVILLTTVTMRKFPFSFLYGYWATLVSAKNVPIKVEGGEHQTYNVQKLFSFVVTTVLTFTWYL